MSKACEYLNEKMPEDTDINDALAEFQLTGDEVFKDIQKIISSRKVNSSVGVRPFTLNNDDDDDDDVNILPNGKENQSSSNSRATRGGRSTANKSTASKTTANKTTTPSRGRGASRAATGPSARNTSV